MKRIVQKKSPKVISQKLNYLKENAIDMISLLVAFASLITSIIISVHANEIAVRSQPIEYLVTVSNQIKTFEYDGKMYATDGVDFKQMNGFQAGTFSSIFVSTVQNDIVDIAYIPYKVDEMFQFAYEPNNGMQFYMDKEIENKLLFGPSDMEMVESINNKLQVFHILFKGYNREYTIYSIVYTLDGKVAIETFEKDGEPISLPTGTLNCYILNEDNIYEYENYQQIADDFNKGKSDDLKITSRQIFETIIKERKLCGEQMKNSH